MGKLLVEVFNSKVDATGQNQIVFLGQVNFDTEVLAKIPAPSKHELKSKTGDSVSPLVGGKIRVQLLNGDQFKLLGARRLKEGDEVFVVVSDARSELGRSSCVSNSCNPDWENITFAVPKHAATPKKIHTVVEGGDLPGLLDALTHADWDINTQHHGSSNRTLLHKAVQQGNVDCVKILLDAGADYLIRDDDGNTPLELAAAHLQKECCAVISKRVMEDMVSREHMLRQC
jgi:hypothetical protein